MSLSSQQAVANILLQEDVTVFVPLVSSSDNLPTVSALSSEIADALFYSIVPGSLSFSNLVDAAPAVLTSVASTSGNINAFQISAITSNYNVTAGTTNTVVLSNGYSIAVTSAAVPPIECSNGYIHFVDRALTLPMSMTATLASDPSYSILLSLLSELNINLDNYAGMTLFGLNNYILGDMDYASFTTAQLSEILQAQITFPADSDGNFLNSLQYPLSSVITAPTLLAGQCQQLTAAITDDGDLYFTVGGLSYQYQFAGNIYFTTGGRFCLMCFDALITRLLTH